MTKPILLVEDEENDVFFFTKALAKLDIENPLRIACDGQQALEYIEGHDKFSNREEFPLPYLVLLDLKLPKVKGLDVLKRARRVSDPNLIIIILSSSQDETDIAEAYRLGANAYLSKPANFDGLVTAVRAINDFWLKHNLTGGVTRSALRDKPNGLTREDAVLRPM